MIDQERAAQRESDQRWWDNVFRAINLTIVLLVPFATVLLTRYISAQPAPPTVNNVIVPPTNTDMFNPGSGIGK
jgi:hypothetical protein